jgi:hypothetical protein
MQRTHGKLCGTIVVLLLSTQALVAQAGHSNATLVVNGQSGQAAVIQQNGRTFVDLAALAQIANGSLSFKGNTISLNVPGSGGAAAPADTTKATDDTTLSRAFMKAGIEEMALLREWGAAVAYAIQNGYPLQEQWANNYRGKAESGLQMASAAASTTGDKSALQLLSNEYDGVRQWSDKLVQASKNMETAKYSMSPDSLRQEPQTQKLITCWRFLGSMMGNGSFQNDDSCH